MLESTNGNTLRELKKAPLLSRLSSLELSRLYAHMSIHEFEKGEILYRDSEKAQFVHIVKEGRVELVSHDDKGKRMMGPDLLGVESIISSQYQNGAVGVESGSIIKIPKEAIIKLINENGKIKTFLYEEMLKRAIKKIPDDEQGSGAKISELGSQRSMIGWALAIIVPMLLYFLTSPENYAVSDKVDSYRLHLFMAMFSTTVVMWVFKLTVEAIASLFLILAIQILGIADEGLTLSGFASGTFFMALSVLCMGTVLVGSGLTYRLVLLILRMIPGSQFWYSLCMFGAGLLLTPILPSANGRVNLFSPLYIDLLESIQYKPGGKASTKLAVATFMGASLFSALFLSSKAINFAVYGLLPLPVQEQFSWVYWTKAASVSALFIFVLYMISVMFLLKNNENQIIPKKRVHDQLELLGPVRYPEWVAFICVLLFFAGMITVSFHKVGLPWIGLALVFVYFVMEVLKKKEFQTKIDWPFLILLGSLVGLVKAMNAIGFDDWIAYYLQGLGTYMREDFGLFVLLLTASMMVVRLAVPGNATIAIFCSIFLPMATQNGLNPWVVGFIIIMMSDTWLFPYQCTYYLGFRGINPDNSLYAEKDLLKINMITNVARLLSIYVSIPYWRALGII